MVGKGTASNAIGTVFISPANEYSQFALQYRFAHPQKHSIGANSQWNFGRKSQMCFVVARNSARVR